MTALDQAFIKAYSREREPRRMASTIPAAGHDAWPTAEPAAAPPVASARAAGDGNAPALRFDFGAGAVPAPIGPIWPWATPALPGHAPAALGNAGLASAALGSAGFLPSYAPPAPARLTPVAPPAINPALPAWGPWNDDGRWSPVPPTAPLPPAAPPAAARPEAPASSAIDLSSTSDIILFYAGQVEHDLDEPSLALGPVMVQPTFEEELLAPALPAPATSNHAAAPAERTAAQIGLDPCCVPRALAEATIAPPAPLPPVAPLAWEPTRTDRGSAAAPAKEPRFQPQWEVEQFAWPAACDRVIAAQDAAFAGLLERIVLSAASGEKIVAVAGCSPGDGKSTLILCLAREAARAGLSVALVDADFDHPQLAELLAVAPPRGWEEALAGDLPLVETSVASAVDGVHLFPLQAGRCAPDEERQAALVEALELLGQRHDLVLVDMGTVPAEDASLAPPPEKSLLAAVLLRDCRRVDESQALRIARQLRSAGVEVLGRVDNFR